PDHPRFAPPGRDLQTGKSAGGATASGGVRFSALQPVHELIQGGDPDLVCTKYGISRTELDEMLRAYQASRRQAAVSAAAGFTPLRSSGAGFSPSKTARNDPCPCGSGKKYKKCCLPAHEEAGRLIPRKRLQQMEEGARAKEKIEKEVRRGFELIFLREYERAERYAKKQIESSPEDDRFHDIQVSACLGLGDYDAAFRIARRRWQTAVEEKLFFQENGYHKREGIDRAGHVHFYPPSTWLEKFWIAQRARTWREQYGKLAPARGGSPYKAVEKLQSANDVKRFPAKHEDGLEARRLALAPVLERIKSEGPGAIPFLLPITYNYSWACLFVPGLLDAIGSDECLRLLAELSMFRYPHFSQECLVCLEKTGERAIPVIYSVLEENPAFDELKAGLLNVLGNLPCEQSFEILARFTEHENLYVAARACEALGRHKNPDAQPYLERARQRIGPSKQISDAVKEIAESSR
ncbi:MAG TPA: SEC-C metal-binding domain-containing protein, partial [Syntrophobacteraceae bacterium]|nr:SEC-C metal-binding domain-containing protein [Syntrophobacteraceae bacterium]